MQLHSFPDLYVYSSLYCWKRDQVNYKKPHQFREMGHSDKSAQSNQRGGRDHNKEETTGLKKKWVAMAKEQRSRFYILWKCAIMLLCWDNQYWIINLHYLLNFRLIYCLYLLLWTTVCVHQFTSALNNLLHLELVCVFKDW